MGKTDTSDIEALFIETPVKKGRNNRVGAKPVKQAKNGLQSYSTWQLVKELWARHCVNIQITAFWLLLAVVVWGKLR